MRKHKGLQLFAFIVILLASLIISGLLLSGCSDSTAPRLKLRTPSSLHYYTNDDEVNISFYCDNIDELWLDDYKFYDRERDYLCGTTGMDFDLEEGTNEFNFNGIYDPDSDRDRVRLNLVLEYDEDY